MSRRKVPKFANQQAATSGGGWTPDQEAWIEAKRMAAADSAFLYGLIRTHDIEVDTNKGNTTPNPGKAN